MVKRARRVDARLDHQRYMRYAVSLTALIVFRRRLGHEGMSQRWRSFLGWGMKPAACPLEQVH